MGYVELSKTDLFDLLMSVHKINVDLYQIPMTFFEYMSPVRSIAHVSIFVIMGPYITLNDDVLNKGIVF